MSITFNKFGGAVVSNCDLGTPDGLCKTFWNPRTPCPNQAEWIVKNHFNEGFSIMCDVHKQGFEESFSEFEGAVGYLPYDQKTAEELYSKFLLYQEKTGGKQNDTITN